MTDGEIERENTVVYKWMCERLDKLGDEAREEFIKFHQLAIEDALLRSLGKALGIVVGRALEHGANPLIVSVAANNAMVEGREVVSESPCGCTEAKAIAARMNTPEPEPAPASEPVLNPKLN